MADSTVSPTSTHQALDLSDEQALRMHRLMLMTRAIDERIWALNRQGRVGITAPCRGHEATQIGCAFAFDPRRDVFLPYYRSLGVLVTLGLSPLELMLDAIGRADGPFSHGRQMPFHWTGREPRLLSPSSCVATQLPHAVGAALACRLRGERASVLVTFGDGATSKGDFHEALNFAAIHRLPVVFYCENNQYAISVPLDKQMAVKRVAERAAAYGMPGRAVDGNDVLAVFDAARTAVGHTLAGEGPYLLEAVTYRVMPHTSNDDDMTYRTAAEVAAWRARDPIARFRAYLLEQGLIDEQADRELVELIEREVGAATQQALDSPDPAAETALDHVFAPGTRNAPRLDPAKAVPSEIVQSLQSEIGA